jgi:transcriptional regulator with XRE-family HTH domain
MTRAKRKDITTGFGQRIHPYLEALGLEQPKDFCRKVGVDVSTARRWMYETEHPSAKGLKGLLRVGIPPAAILYALTGIKMDPRDTDVTYNLSKEEWELIQELRSFPGNLQFAILRIIEVIQGLSRGFRRKPVS